MSEEYFALEVKDYSYMRFILEVFDYLQGATLRVSKKGLDFINYDPTRITLTHVHYAAEDFDSFNHYKDYEEVIYLDSLYFYKKLIRGRTFSWKMNQILHYFSFKNEHFTSNYSQMVHETDFPKINEKSYSRYNNFYRTEIVLPCAVFKKVLEEVNDIIDGFTIKATKDSLTIEVNKERDQDLKIDYSADLNPEFVKSLNKDQAKASFWTLPLLKILKFFPEKKGDLQLNYNTNEPMRLHAKIRKKSFITFFISPRITEEDLEGGVD